MVSISSFANTEDEADILWYNGKVISMDNSKGVYEAIAIKGDKIIGVGGKVVYTAK